MMWIVGVLFLGVIGLSMYCSYLDYQLKEGNKNDNDNNNIT